MVTSIMLKEIRQAWGWVGIEPEEVVGENAFGNLLIRDNKGQVWRLCPEELSCEVVATDNEAYAALLRDEDFLLDWEMEELVNMAREQLGSLEPDKKYCLKIPGLLGGEYEADNLAMVSLAEIVNVSGSIAEQIRDLPPGSKVRLKVVD